MRTLINTVLWIVLLAAIGHMMELDNWLCQTKEVSPAGISSLTFSDAADGRKILAQWSAYTHANLLLKAKQSLHTDFIYILCYVALIWRLSYTQMLREYRPLLNDVLRLNILLGILVGLLDATENVMLLHDVTLFSIGGFWSTRYVAIAKYSIAAWVILAYLFSVVSLWVLGARPGTSMYIARLTLPLLNQ